jgi:Radical SAM superfamily
MHALIFADNKYQPNRMGILRAPGAHRIATHLRRLDINVEVVDFYLNWSVDELKQIIDCQLSKPTLFIAISCSLMFDGVEEFSEIRDYIRSKNPNVAIVIGGNKTLQKGFSGADYYIEGPGETAMTALTEYLIGKTQDLKYELIDGNRVLNSLTDYPVKSMKDLDISYLPSDFIGEHEVLSLETARGCIFKCAFCDFPGIGKKKLDYLRDISEIREELIKNYRDNGTTKYFVVEDTINDTDEKCELLSELGLTLPFKLSLMGYMRADLLISKPRNVQKLINAGFRGMHFGIETFNEQAGKIIGKGMPPKKMKEGLVNIKKQFPNLFLTSTFIVGLPYETREEIIDSVDWIIRERALDFWSFNPLVIPKKDPTVHHSYFTDNYQLYGYTRMQEDEFDSRKHELENTAFGLKWWKNMIHWKSKTFDFISAAAFVSEISKKSYPYRKIDGWSAFAMSGLGIDLDELLRMSYNGENKIDDIKIIKDTTDYIDDYKRKKLEFFEKSFNRY